MKIIKETDTYVVFIEDDVKKIKCKKCGHISDNEECLRRRYCSGCNKWLKKNKK